MKKNVIPVFFVLAGMLLTASSGFSQAETEESLYMKGINAYIKREFKAAAYYWKRVLEINPQNDKSQKYMEKAFEKYNLMETHFYNGLSFFNVNDFTNAISHFQETLMINPNHQKAIYYLNLCYQTLSLFDKRKNKEEMEAQVVQMMQENEFRKAVAMYKILVMLDPDNERMKLALADAESQLKSTDLKDELQIHLEAARQFSKEEKYTASIAEWKKVLIIDPENTEAKIGLERDIQAQKQKETQDKVNYFIAQGMDEFINKQYKDSRNSFQKVLQLDPHNETAQDYIDRIDSVMKSQADEQTAFDESNKHLTQGILHYTNERYIEALDEFQTALSIYEQNEEAKKYIELTRKKMKESERQKLLETEQETQRLLEKAVELYNLNEYRKSKTVFQQVLDLDPQNEMALNYLRLISETLDLEMKSQVTIDSPYFPIYTRFMEEADREFRRNNFEASLAYLKEVLTLFPLNKPGQKFRLKVLYRTDPAKFNEVLAGYIQSGKDYLNKTQYRFAKNEFMTVKEIAPDFPGIDGLLASCVPKPKSDIAVIEKQYNTGLLFYQQGKFSEAEGSWRKVIELDNSPDSNPYYAKAFLNMAKARQKMGGGPVTGMETPSSADSEQEKQIRKSYYMGVAYYTQGQYQKAIDEWRKVLNIDKNYVLAINNIQKAKKKLEYAK